MLKIRSYLQRVQNVFTFIDTLGRIAKRTTVVAVAGAVVVTSVTISVKNVKGAAKAEIASENVYAASDDTRDETEIDVNIFNIALPENEADTLEKSSIVEEVFLTANAGDSLDIEFTNVKKEPEPVISQVKTNTVAAPIYTSKVVNYTEEDYQALCRIVEAEATGCDIIGKILVANVVINRVNSPRFANTITDVIFSPRQFSPISDGRYYTVTVSQSTIEAVDRALDGEDYSQGALYFAATYCVERGNCWAANHMRTLFEHDGHVFFAP